MFRYLLITTLLFGPLQVSAADIATDSHFMVKLVAESRTPAPGKRLTLALQLIPEPGWHTYWSNPGEAGFPPRAEWTLPAGFSAGGLQHPVPSELVIDGFRNNVHEGSVTLLTDISVPTALHRGTAIPIGLKLNLAICSEGRCLPRKVNLNLALTAGNGLPDPEQTTLFRDARAALPSPLAAPLRYQVEDTTLKLFSPLPVTNDIVSITVFFDDDGIVAGGAQRLEITNGKVTIAMPRGDIQAGNALSGVIRIVHSGQPGGHESTQGYSFIAQPAVVSH